MSMSLLRWGALTMAALAWLAGSASAQAMGRPLVVAGGGVQPTGITGFVGLPGGPGLAAGITPLAPGTGGLNPYALSTVGGFNPYLGTGALSSSGGSWNSPYSMSTTPGLPYPNPSYGWWPNPFYMDPGVGLGYTLQGYSEVVRAFGQYNKDVQTARVIREQSRQEQVETARRRQQFEMWMWSIRPTVPKMREQEAAMELDRFRKDASDGDITSGRALNVLLRSIAQVGSTNLSRGPRIPLEEDTLKQINLTSGAAGNIGLLRTLKAGGKLTWPEALQEEGYRDATKNLEVKLNVALAHVDGMIPVDVIRDIRAYNKTISDKLKEQASDLTPDQYLAALRFMKQIDGAIRALTDPNVTKFFNTTWNAKGKSVAELVEFMLRQGLTFNAATQGDEASYRALYQAMRQFEVGLQSAQR